MYLPPPSIASILIGSEVRAPSPLMGEGRGEGETGMSRGKRDRTRALSITIIFTVPHDAKNQRMTRRARELRRNSSDAERRLWSFLRSPGFAKRNFVGKHQSVDTLSTLCPSNTD